MVLQGFRLRFYDNLFCKGPFPSTCLGVGGKEKIRLAAYNSVEFPHLMNFLVFHLFELLGCEGENPEISLATSYQNWRKIVSRLLSLECAGTYGLLPSALGAMFSDKWNVLFHIWLLTSVKTSKYHPAMQSIKLSLMTITTAY